MKWREEQAWLMLSTISWFNPPDLYFLSRIRNIISQMNTSQISSSLSTDILTIGISSITPMLYLSMDTPPNVQTNNIQMCKLAKKMYLVTAQVYSPLNNPSSYSSSLLCVSRSLSLPSHLPPSPPTTSSSSMSPVAFSFKAHRSVLPTQQLPLRDYGK